MFAKLALSQELLSVVQELGFEKMTPIQEQAIPPMLEGKDLIGQSKTGSGKTAAFALPILQKIDLSSRQVQAMILCPTRELAAQVIKDIRRFGRRLDGLQVLALSGGQPARDQLASLQKGVHIIVGTPGRILDILERGRLDLSDVKTIIMDEADRMLDMGFKDEMTAIMKKAPKQRQTVFFSATFPEAIQELSRYYQKNPIKIIIENEKEIQPMIEQILYEYKEDDQVPTLLRALQQHPSKSTLIFCNQKATVDHLVELIAKQGVSCKALHGDLEQRDRDRVMAMFRNSSIRILIATDVAARGLDIDQLELVINFDFPNSPETYIHRIGRVGRAGRKGLAVTLVKPFDGMKILEIETVTKVKFLKPNLGFKNQFGLALAMKDSSMETLLISGGRQDKLRPGDILGALTGESGGFQASDIGQIEILDRCAYIAVSTTIAGQALDKLRTGKIKGRKFRVSLAQGK